MFSFKDKIVIVTGGATGIGKAVVDSFVDTGAIVFSTFHTRRNDNDKSFLSVKLDVRNYTECGKFVNNILEKFGKIDILINVAGIEKENLLIRNTEEDWSLIVDTNLKSVFNMTKFAIVGMLKNGGSIVNVSSILGVFGGRGESIYSASKAGIIGFSKSIAKEYGSRNIRCNVVAPGIVKTAMTEKLLENREEELLNMVSLKRFAVPEDIANLILFLSSEKASFITGQTVQIDGGMII